MGVAGGADRVRLRRRAPSGDAAAAPVVRALRRPLYGALVGTARTPPYPRRGEGAARPPVPAWADPLRLHLQNALPRPGRLGYPGGTTGGVRVARITPLRY